MLTYTNMAQTGHRATWHWAVTQSQPGVGAVHRSADWDRWHLTKPLEEKQGWIKGRPIPVQQQPAPIPVDQHQWRVAVFQEEEQVAMCCLPGDNKVNFHPPEVVPPAVGLSTPSLFDIQTQAQSLNMTHWLCGLIGERAVPMHCIRSMHNNENHEQWNNEKAEYICQNYCYTMEGEPFKTCNNGQ